jgi:hypothetical protein
VISITSKSTRLRQSYAAAGDHEQAKKARRELLLFF